MRILTFRYHRIIKESVLVSDIDYSDSKALASAIEGRDRDYLKHIVLSKNGQISYPIVLKSIFEHGWIPDFREASYNDSSAGYHPARLYRKNNLEPLDRPILGQGGNRFLCLKHLNIEKADYFVRYEQYYTDVNPEEMNPLIDLALRSNILQQFSIGENEEIRTKPRDNCDEILNLTKLNLYSFFCGKTVLDVSTHSGWYAMAAKWLGASEVTGFDIEGDLIDIAKRLANLFKLDVKFSQSSFENYDVGQHDVVMANSCVYHFDLSGKEILDRLCSAAKESLIMHTVIRDDDDNGAWGNERIQDDGKIKYIVPSKMEITNELLSRGFRDIHILEGVRNPLKKIVVAHRSLNLYYYPNDMHKALFSKSDEDGRGPLL